MLLTEKHVNRENSTTEYRVAPSMQGKVSIVDGMAELQSLDKPTWITTCSQLAEHDVNQLLQKCSESDEIYVVFDSHKSTKVVWSGSGVLQDNRLDQHW